MVTGGQNSYGTGGYFKSPLDPLLPVSMELRKEHRKLSLAMVVALDRSGSMAAPVSGGKTKMDLANVATAEALSQLSGADQFGCLAVDSSAHEILPLSDVTNKDAMKSKILGIQSMGGGIFVYEALQHAAAMIAPATSGTKHIILFSDAADSEEPGDYVNLLDSCLKAGITVSVVGLGSDMDSDAGLLRDIALKGGGNCYFTNDPHELPQIFAQDTFLVSRSAFIEDVTPVRTTPILKLLTSQSWDSIPDVGGYNLCYLRPGANLAAVTQDDYEAPLVATWQAGTGRVLCFTGEADGKYTGPLGAWPQSGEFLSSMTRWVTAQDQGLGHEMMLTQELRGSKNLVKLHLDPERESTPFSVIPQLTVLRGDSGYKPDVETIPMSWSSADTLTAEIPLYGGETLLTSLDLKEIGQTTLPPTCLPYSAEYAVHAEGDGLRTLERLSKATGGMERVNIASIWSDLPQMPQRISLAPWLLLLALPLLLIEILQRRTSWFTQLFVRRAPAVQSAGVPAGKAVSSRKTSAAERRSHTPEAAPAPTAVKPATPAARPAASQPPPSQDALAQARNRAARRTHRHDSN